MPTISLRLTDEEHAALKDWAHGSHRSMQREAVYRIFQERSLSERGPDLGGAASQAGRVDKALDAAQRADLPRSESDLHFKPDFK